MTTQAILNCRYLKQIPRYPIFNSPQVPVTKLKVSPECPIWHHSVGMANIQMNLFTHGQQVRTYHQVWCSTSVLTVQRKIAQWNGISTYRRVPWLTLKEFAGAWKCHNDYNHSKVFFLFSWVVNMFSWPQELQCLRNEYINGYHYMHILWTCRL